MSSQMLDNQPPVPAAPQSGGGFLTPKLEPGQSPPPYPGPELSPLVTPGPTESSDFGPEQMEEDEGRRILVSCHTLLVAN